MNIIEELLGSDTADVIQEVGRQFGIDESQASSAVAALVPVLLAGFHQSTAHPSGLEALEAALRGGQHHRYVNDLQSLGQPDTINVGNGLLGQIFGSKDVSREVARRASMQSGVGTEVLKRMLPVLAAVAAGALARRQLGGASAQASLVPTPASRSQGGSLFDMLSPMLDANRDGTMVDDVIGMIGKAVGGR